MKERKPKQPKKVSYEILQTESLVGHPMYVLLEDLVVAYHPELERARIALAWCTSWKPDVDGRVTLGKCKKASDLDRELAAYDFVILLRKSFWLDPRVSDAQRRALLDHELCHAALKYDDAGAPVEDERGRLVYRTRKHDIEEFTDIVTRYGTWTADLERFAFALRRSGVPAYQPCDDCRELPGWVYVTDDAGHQRVMRCECFARWTQQLALRDAV
jgi:hypothetical protein